MTNSNIEYLSNKIMALFFFDIHTEIFYLIWSEIDSSWRLLTGSDRLKCKIILLILRMK